MKVREHLEIVEDREKQIERLKQAHTRNMYKLIDTYVKTRNKLRKDLEHDTHEFGRILAYFMEPEEFDKFRTKLSRYLMSKNEDDLETMMSSILLDLHMKKEKGQIKPDIKGVWNPK